MNHRRPILYLLLLFAAPFAAKGQGVDSLKTREDRLAAEINLYIDRALKDGMIDRKGADSLHVLAGLNVGDCIRMETLQGIMDELDALYEASMRAINENANQRMAFYKGMLPTVLKAPDDYESPMERRHKAEMDAAMRVKESVANNLKADEMSPFLKWVKRIGSVLFRNDYGSSGKMIPQKGGLYYLYIPERPPQPSSSFGAE